MSRSERNSQLALTHKIANPSAIHAPKLWNVVVQRMRTRIAAGELTPGDSLPSEAEMLKQFGISRPTLREALRVLESENLIQLGRGARFGATVLGPTIETASRYSGLYLATQGTTLGEVHQVRTMLEPSLVAQLAKRPKKEFIRALRECVDDERKAIDGKDYVAAVTIIDAFHRLLVQVSENRTLSLLSGMLHAIPARVYRQVLSNNTPQAQQALRRRMEKASEAHARIVELIAGGKATNAESFWHSYMQDTAAFLTRSKLADRRVEAPA